MNNLKYHLLNSVGVIIFSVVTAVSINTLIRYSISPGNIPQEQQRKRISVQGENRSPDYYFTPVLESGFFKIAAAEFDDDGYEEKIEPESADDLQLAGTVTGPRAIALAMIRKRGEKEPGVFSLIKRETGISNDVYGYTLTEIADKHVKLQINNRVIVLELYNKNNKTDSQKKAGPQRESSASPDKIERNISRAEIQQRVLNNMDNALRGLTAGPHRVNNEIVGYRIIRLQPYNILYQYGARTGDIIKRINGHALDSTEKLYRMWEIVQSESQIRVDLERGGRPLTFNFTITE